MNKRPEIIKRRRREVTDSVNTYESSITPKKSLPSEEAEASPPTAPSVEEIDQSIESFEAPTPTEYWEAIEPPPPISPNSLSAWQPELREIAWEQQFDVWETFLYD